MMDRHTLDCRLIAFAVAASLLLKVLVFVIAVISTSSFLKAGESSW